MLVPQILLGAAQHLPPTHLTCPSYVPVPTCQEDYHTHLNPKLNLTFTYLSLFKYNLGVSSNYTLLHLHWIKADKTG